MRRDSWLGWLVASAAPMFFSAFAAAQECAPVVGALASIEGEVEVQGEADTAWRAARLAEPLCAQHTIRTGKLSRAAVALINEEVLRLDQETVVRLADIQQEATEPSIVELVLGAFYSFSRSPRRVEVRTTYMNLAIRGTEFLVRADAAESQVTVLEGVVAASSPAGELSVAEGGSAVGRAGAAPQPVTLVRPRDAVQWSLYYPPILAVLGGQRDLPPDLPPARAEALRLAGAGRIEEALAVLERAPDAATDARIQLDRAALLLSVGRVDEARTAIDRALALDPNAGLAYALRGVIDVVQNRRAEALESTRRAVELSPESTAARIALSYAQQADFQLPEARDTLLEATARQPDDALAWARLAELWLATGYRDRAREAADRAAALSPEIAQVQIVRGFAELAEFNTFRAKLAFDHAIALAPADPMPRLGLGLAQIRDGALEEGRRNLELAVALSSSTSLLRSYLGKAYFEEKRDPLAGDQYRLAKELDPLDPTPYLYDAIRKQTENRPVEALADIERSIALNDNRAVYRSRLGLDEDRAARGTSLARIYNDLGFLNLGIREATKSLAYDPANAGAHRFLSDVYTSVPRTEISRVSELLQAQLLQNININPVQPSLSETSLNIVTQGGPANPGLDEWTPLFERNQVQLDSTGVVGNEDTLGGEAVASALYGRYSLSVGAFRYKTDGWRDNNDIDHTIYNLFFQTAITPELNAQIELRRRESDNGDIDFNFDPDSFFPNEKNQLHQDIARAGLRYSPSPNSDFLLSFIYTDRDQKETDSADATDFSPSQDFDVRTEDRGYQIEGQHIYRREGFSLITGAAFSSIDTDFTNKVTIGAFPPFFPEPFNLLDESTTTQGTDRHGYVYGTFTVPQPVTWTLGVSYNDFEQDPVKVEKVNPKFGVQWNVTDTVRLRAAAFQTVKPVLANNRTIEPTQVAGFNQFYDDVNGDVSRVLGLGVDWRARSSLSVGADAIWRDQDVHYADFTDDEQERTTNFDEQRSRLYAYWTPWDRLAVSGELVYDRFDANQSNLTDQGPVPERLETVSTPFWVRYFDPSGFFAGIGATFVYQDLKRTQEAITSQGLSDGDDSFWLLDAQAGYRFPRRLGLISVELNNILDQKFHYQDDSFREFRDTPTSGRFIPDQRIFVRLSLHW